MTSLIDRIARFETALRALMNEENAAMIAALAHIALRTNCPCFGNHIPSDDEANLCVDWADIEEHFGMPRHYLGPDLKAADSAAQCSLGFCALQSNYAYGRKGDLEIETGSILTLSSEFAAILMGSAAPRHWPKLKTSLPLPDRDSQSFIAFVHEIARSGGSALLYRHNEADETTHQYEMTAFAEALAIEDEMIPLFIAADLDLTWRRLKLLPALLAAILHLPERAIILAPFKDQFAGRGIAKGDYDEDENGPVKMPPLDLAHDARKIGSLLPHLMQTVMITVPNEGHLPLSCAAAFAGAIGPFRFDQADMVKRIKTSIAESPITERTAQHIFDTLGGAHHAQGLLKTVEKMIRLATLNPKRVKGQDETTRAKDADALAHDLVASLAPLFETGDRSGGHGAPRRHFDPELLICEPDLQPYLNRAARLREAGIKILIAGPPGTGKTALAAELAYRMGIPLREIRGGDIFARAWGGSERLIKKTFASAKRDQVMLFVDEADAILADRARQDANRSLVVTATGEFLKFIDGHPLPMVAATNFLEDIDKAIIRRFDLVLHAKPLPEDREIIAWRKILKLEPPAGFRSIGETVVADYVLTTRRLDLFGEQSADHAAAILREVVSAREGPQKPDFGFLAEAN